MNAIISGKWARYINTTKDEHIQIRQKLNPQNFHFTYNDFLSIPDKNWLLRKSTPLIIFLAGSALTSAVDKYSDYDIVIISRDMVVLNSDNCYTTFDDRHIHSYVHTMDSLINVYPEDAVTAIGLVKHAQLQKTNILFSAVDPAVIDSLIAHRYDMFQVGALRFDQNFRQNIETVIKNKKFLNNTPIKPLATAIEIKCILKKERISKYIEQILKVKRAKRIPLNDFDFAQLLNDLQDYCNLMDEYNKTHTVEEAVENWKSSYAYQAIMSDESNS